MINKEIENIGARRLHTIMERLLEDVSFEASEIKEALIVDRSYVKKQLDHIVKRTDLSKFIL